MLRLANIEEIEALLLQLPALVQQQERHSTEFARLAGTWLEALERALVANRLHQAATIAALRSTLIAAKQGQVPAGLTFRGGRPTRWRVSNAIASEALRRATEIANVLMEDNKPRFQDAERVAQQLAAVAVSRGVVGARAAGVTNTDYLAAVRRRILELSELATAMVHLEGLVGPHDALVLIDRALSPHAAAMARVEPALPAPGPVANG